MNGAYGIGSPFPRTRVMSKTGNLKAVMMVMGQSDTSTTMRYLHPELEQVRQVLDEPTLTPSQATATQDRA